MIFNIFIFCISHKSDSLSDSSYRMEKLCNVDDFDAKVSNFNRVLA